ncbi:MAG TPA: TonB-dependent receptor [Rhizomicrobium sp.]|jgi:iron complex outermembrane receptor protein|nr:TonB-dependent receptor [Rhizomicrobium sp.]
MGRSFLLGAASAAALLYLTVPAAAQDQPQQAQPQQAKPVEVRPAQATGMEVVVVTARRRAENLEKVPVADTALSGETLRTDNINSALALQNHVPSLTVAANLGSRDDDVFTIRGQSQPFGGADPGVQTYFAEVPFNAGGPGSEYDMDNIQVLKGPQGTLFGRNTTGGAILFEPKRPDDQFGGYFDGSAGDYGLRELKGAINLPLTDTFAVRMAGDFLSRDGYTKDISTGQNLDNENVDAFRIGATWKPSANFQNYFVFDYLRDHNNGTGAELTGVNTSTIDSLAGEVLGAPCTNPPMNATCGALQGFEQEMLGALAQQQALGPRKTTSSIPLGFKRESWGATDIATFDVAAHLHLENIFGFRSDKEQPSFDYDGSDLPILDIPNSRTWESNSLQVTEEFQVKGETADNGINWIAGFYHELDHPGGYSEVERQTLGGPQPMASPFYGFGDTEIDSLGNGGTSNAVYGSATYDAASWLNGLSFTAGGRYTWDHKVATDKTCVLLTAGDTCPFPLPNAAPYEEPTHQASFRAPSWNLTAQDQVTDDTMVYADYRRGYKSGGFNSGATGATDYEEFQPEYLTDVELGTKNNWTILGVPGRTNFDVYYGWYSNIQKNDEIPVEQTVEVAPGTYETFVEPAALTFNAARATVKGAEFESTFIPAELLQVEVFYSYTDATYQKFVLPQLVAIGPTGSQSTYGLTNHAGSPFAYTPKNKFGITPRFHIPIDPAWGEPWLSGTFYWQSREWFTDLSDSETTCSAFIAPTTPGAPYTCLAPAGQRPEQRSYSLINLRLDWNNFMGQPFDLSAFVDNVTNQTYKQGADALLHLTGTSASIYGPPRMWGLELRYRFGADADGGN